jgi:CTP:molybdopterin cytidylyltransferase MocA
LIAPVDHPRVKRETVVRILDVLSEQARSEQNGVRGPEPPESGTWVQPRFDNRGGHPIAIDASGAQALVSVDPSSTLREALDSAGLHHQNVVVGDPHVLENLNAPEDLP